MRSRRDERDYGEIPCAMRTLVFIVVFVLAATSARADRAGVEVALKAMGEAAAG